MKTFCKAVATAIERTPRKSLPAHHFDTVGEDVFAVVSPKGSFLKKVGATRRLLNFLWLECGVGETR